MELNELDAARENDRRVRAQIDALLGGLSPFGKIELSMRLAMEGARGLVQERVTVPLRLPARAELAAPATSSTPQRDGAPGEEAHAETVSAAPNRNDESTGENLHD